jgi:hypothetical protein
MSQKGELKSFINDLRGCIMLADLLKLSLEAQLMDDNTSGWLYKDLSDIEKSINRLYYHMEQQNAMSWFFIREELDGERVENLHWLIAESWTIGNLEEVIEAIRNSKETVTNDNKETA